MTNKSVKTVSSSKHNEATLKKPVAASYKVVTNPKTLYRWIDQMLFPLRYLDLPVEQMLHQRHLLSKRLFQKIVDRLPPVDKLPARASEFMKNDFTQHRLVSWNHYNDPSLYRRLVRPIVQGFLKYPAYRTKLLGTKDWLLDDAAVEAINLLYCFAEQEETGEKNYKILGTFTLKKQKFSVVFVMSRNAVKREGKLLENCLRGSSMSRTYSFRKRSRPCEILFSVWNQHRIPVCVTSVDYVTLMAKSDKQAIVRFLKNHCRFSGCKNLPPAAWVTQVFPGIKDVNNIVDQFHLLAFEVVARARLNRLNKKLFPAGAR